MKLNLYLLLFTILFLTACDDDDTPTTQSEFATGLLVLNEGSFQQDLASISHIDTETKQVTNNVFNQVNGRNLGDIGQSMSIVGDLMYIIVNNSQKIEVVNTNTLETIQTITGFASPRYFLSISNDKAYVSNLFGGKVDIVDLNNFSITDSFSMPCEADTNFCWTEQMVFLNDKAFVASMKDAEILVINTTTDELEKRIKVGIDPNSLVLTSSGDLWVLCGGGFAPPLQENAALYRIDTDALEVAQSWQFDDINETPDRLNISSDEQSLYYLNGGVYRFDVNDTELPTTPVVSSNDHFFYNLSMHPETDNLYLTDAIDFQQNGLLFEVDGQTYAFIDTFEVGVIPSKVYFR